MKDRRTPKPEDWRLDELRSRLAAEKPADGEPVVVHIPRALGVSITVDGHPRRAHRDARLEIAQSPVGCAGRFPESGDVRPAQPPTSRNDATRLGGEDHQREPNFL